MPNNKNGDDNHVSLKVGELTERGDFGRGVVRFSAKDMKRLSITEGDAVEVEGKRRTIATAVRAYPADAGLDVVRMDGLVRKNSGAGIGEPVKLRKSEIKEAKRVTIAPARKGIMIQLSSELMRRNMLMRPVMTGDIVIPNPIIRPRRENSNFFESAIEDFFGVDVFFGFGEEKFVIVSTDPKGPVRITKATDIEVLPQATEVLEEEKIPDVTYEDLGGMHEEVKLVREMIELPLKHPELFERLGVEPPKGVLLHGHPGTGKTLLAKAVANESGARFFVINGPEVMSKWYGQSEENLRKIFDQAEKEAPSIIFIDEIDSIAPKREEVRGDVEKRVVSQLLTLLDGLKSRGKVVVIGATNIPNSLDPALRRPGRLDRELEIRVPSKKGRKEILQIHTRGMPLAKEIDLEKIVDVTHGFVGADIAALCKEAAMHALRRVHPDLTSLKENKPLSEEDLKKLIVIPEDFNYALKMVEPSAMREVLIEVPNTKWNDIGGLESTKQLLTETIEWPLKHADSFTRLGIKPPRGVMLYGPPGCGKTMLAKAVANESDANFVYVKASELLSMFVGESEKRVRDIFKRAKQVAPSIIFFDEIESMVPKRGASHDSHTTTRVVSQLLAEMSGLEELHDVVVIAATNRPDLIDPALLRPGRFDRQILVSTPGEKARLQILKIQTKDMPIDASSFEKNTRDDISRRDKILRKMSSDEFVSQEESNELNKSKDELKNEPKWLVYLAKETDGFSGADLEALCREAAMHSMRANMKSDKVTGDDFQKALKDIRPSVTADMNTFYESIVKKKKRHAIEESIDYTG
ncbi:MAG: CDC48 family AAA ATPase [Candidatus Aenigmatarchaeota archaeon]